MKTWSAETLYSADLNAEFDNILDNALMLISPITGTLTIGPGGSIVTTGTGSIQATATTFDALAWIT